MHLRSKGYRDSVEGCLKALRVAFALVVVFWPNGYGLVAQSRQPAVLVPHKSIPEKLAGWPRIDLDVRLSSTKPTSVSALTSDRLIVLEDGVEQPDVKLEESHQPVSLCFVIDTSSSMKKDRKYLTDAAKRLFPINSTDESAIVAFDVRTYLEQDFTTDARKLEAALQHLEFGGGSGLYNAVWTAIDQVASRAAERKKIVVVLSDGEDNFSRVHVEDLIKKARTLNSPIIYWLGLPSVKANTQNLSEVTTATGGISSVSQHITLLNDNADEISQLIQKSYDLRYVSTHSQRDGKLHKVVVKVKSDPGMSSTRTIFRREYYAPIN